MDNKGLKLGQEIIDVMEDKEIKNPIENYPELRDTIENNRYCDQLIENLTNADTIRESIAACGNREQSSVRFSKKIAAVKRRERTMKLVRSVSLVAAAMMTISFIIYYSGVKKEIVAVQNIVVKQEESKPVIVLDNGESIDLVSEVKKTERFEVDKNKLIYSVTESLPVEKIEYNTLVVPAKYTFCVTLSDKTEVYLNANSRLKYPVNFSGDRREVSLEGEGYFKVTKSDKPFIVNTKEISVQVYGTEFNINTNKNRYVEALLVSGSVGVTDHYGETMIKPNELYCLNKESGVSKVEVVDVDEFLAWREGMFKFVNKPLEIILEELAAWYGVSFTFKNESIRGLLLNMSLERVQEVDRIVEILEVAAEIKFTKEEGGRYTVK